ncbi:MAG: ABC transporter ATP-binding protein [Saccharospirillaceae bacterium]|nr:ABC transporter ATP-binding protein [Saccharospirillaceae bacterium]
MNELNENNLNTLLSVDHLSVCYGSGAAAVHAVCDVSFAIAPGEIVGLVGESGSGKSTIAHAAMGLLNQDVSGHSGLSVGGDIQFKGRSLLTEKSHLNRVRGRHIGMMFQSSHSAFNPQMTIGQQMAEAIRWHLKLNKSQALQLALTTLQDVGMPRPEEILHNYAFELSGGMCQRAALAMVMALQPSLILADEPTASLDMVVQAELVRWLADIQKKRGFAMLMISHDLNLIARLADRLLVMYQGEVLEQGDTHSVLTQPQHPYTAELLNAIPRLTQPDRKGEMMAENIWGQIDV